MFFGLEYSDKGNDFLFFNLNKEWLLKNEDMCDIPLKELLTRVRSDGGSSFTRTPSSNLTGSR